jgi:hypothetical protein
VFLQNYQGRRIFKIIECFSIRKSVE